MSGERRITDYAVRILVAGSRGYDNYEEFDSIMQKRVTGALQVYQPHHICFISGKASQGADDMIIHWCKVNGYRCFTYPADWKKNGRPAGIVRNVTMGDLATHALLFWDYKSPGTRHMRDHLKKRQVPMVVYNVKCS